MTWDDVVRAIVTSAIGTVVSVVLGLYLRHVAKLNRDELLRILAGVDAVVVINRKAPVLPLDRYRKAIAAGAGVMLTGLLTWVESADLEPVLGPLVPEPVRPLVGVVLGGVATIAGVILATNAPKPGPVRGAGTLVVPAPSMAVGQGSTGSDRSTGTAPSAAADATPPADEATAAAVADGGPFWAGVQPGAPTSATSIVKLPPPPTRNYQ